MSRRPLRRNRPATRLALQQLEPKLALAVTPALVTDINATPRSSGPSETFVMGSFAYFTAEDASHGRELWKTNGTSAGTSLVKDIDVGSESSNPYGFTVLGNKFFFAADDGVHGTELWVSDGSASGTNLVKDLQTGMSEQYDPLTGLPVSVPASSLPRELTVFNGKLYFTTSGSDGSPTLWKTDGTAAGTQLVAGTAEKIPGLNNGFCALGSQLIFSTSTFDGGTGVNTTKLWKTDGTAAPQEFASREGNGVYSFFVAAGKAFFTFDNGITGYEPWVTDGTSAGTFLLKDINSQANESLPGSTMSANPYGFTALGSNVFFVADDGVHGSELWKTDGTAGNAALVKDIAPGTRLNSFLGLPEPLGSDISSFNVVNGKLIFNANDGTTGSELWQSDGTAGGTSILKDLAAGAASGGADFKLTLFNGEYYFVAKNNSELWKTNGTPSGTVLVEKFQDNSDDGSGSYGAMAVLGSQLLFVGDDGVHGQELWKSDGTAAGTDLVIDLITGTNSAFGATASSATLNGAVYFAANDGKHGTELWKSDGTAGGTALVKDIVLRSSPFGSSPMNPFSFKGAVYFSALDETNNYNRCLWKTDGTADGTVLVKDVRNPRGFASVGDSLYFIAEDDQFQPAIWKTDGTTAGTTPAAALGEVVLTGAESLVAVGNKLFFVGATPGASEEPWYLDTTNNSLNTVEVVPGIAGSNPSKLTLFNGSLYFAGAPAGKTGLYRLNGTTAVKAFEGFVGEVAVAGSTLYFAGDDGVTGSELYKISAGSDGAVLVKDIYQAATAGAPKASSPSKFSAAGSLGYFFANDATGAGFWRTDGSSAGTVKLENAAGSPLLNGSPLGVIGTTLYFIGQDASRGRELWTAPLASATPVNQVPAIDRIELPASRLYRAGEVLQFKVVLTQPVTVVGKPEIALTVGKTKSKAVYQSGSGTNQLVFAYTVKANDIDADGVALGTAIRLPPAASIRFGSTNLPLALPAVNTSGVRVDAVPPKVNAVTGPAAGSYKAGQVLQFTAAVSEAVTVTGLPTIPLVIDTSARQAAYVAGSSTPTALVFQYTVQAGETDTNGIVVGKAITLPTGASIVDAAGNAAVLAIKAPNTARVLVDSAGPVATSITAPAAKTYGVNAPLDFTIVFNEPVRVSGSPTLPLQIGSSARTAAFVGFAKGSGNKSLIFRASPQAGDVDADGIAISGPLNLGSGTIADAAGNAAAGTLPSVNLSRVLVDGVGPSIVSIADPALNGAGTTLIVQLRFNEPVVVRGKPAIPFQIAGSPRQLTYASGSNSTVLTFSYTIRKTDNFDLTVTPGKAIVLAGGAITDRVGNPLSSLNLPSDIVF